MDWDWSRTAERGEEHGYYYRLSRDERYAIKPNATGDWTTFRITGIGESWNSEVLGTFMFAGNAQEACYERARREAGEGSKEEPGGVDQTGSRGEAT